MFGDPILNESNYSIDIVTNTVPRCVTPFVWVNFFSFDDNIREADRSSFLSLHVYAGMIDVKVSLDWQEGCIK